MGEITISYPVIANLIGVHERFLILRNKYIADHARYEIDNFTVDSEEFRLFDHDGTLLEELKYARENYLKENGFEDEEI